MDTIRVCQSCGAKLEADVSQGLCPACLVKQGLETPSSAPGARASSQDFEPPTPEQLKPLFPHLEILELIGFGGMGVVYKARQPQLDRLVALKILPPDPKRDPAFAERFGREARALARLNHPNIVGVHDFGQTEGYFYFVMEFMDGGSLRDLLVAQKLAPREALAIVPKVCEALQYAHDEGIIHRDIKPENILLDRKGRVKIADFGLAKLLNREPASATLTNTGLVMGTPKYMAPEQIETPLKVDHRADIYALGVVLYEMLTGELPLGRFEPPSHRVKVDVRMDEVVLRSLEKRPERRYQHASEIKTDMESIAATQGQEAERAPALAAQGSAVPASTGPDFILCNPRLPRMAQAITIYGIIGAPLFWFAGLVLIAQTKPATIYGEFVQGLLDVVGHGGGLLTAILWCIGGFKLRGLKPSGPRLIKTAVWLNIAIAVLAVAGTIWLEQLAASPEDEKLPPGEILFVSVGFVAIGFEIASLVWLTRNRALLTPLLSRSGITGITSAAAPAGSHFSRKAIIGALWAPFFFAALAGYFFLRATDVMPAGANLMALLLAVMGLSAPIGTTVLGVQALHDVRYSHGRITGLPLALADALLFPLLLLDIPIVAVCGGLLVGVVLGIVRLFQMGGGLGLWEIVLIAVPFGLLVGLVVDGLIVWKAWKAANKPVPVDVPRQWAPSPGRSRRWVWAVVGAVAGLALVADFLRPREELSIREMRLPQGGTEDVRSFAYYLEAPRNHRITLWVESYTNGIRAPIPGLDFGQELVPSRDKPFHGTAQLLFVKEKPAAGGQPAMMRCHWIISEKNDAGSRGGSFRDPFAGMTVQDSTWGQKREWKPRPGETVSLLMLRGGRENLLGAGARDSGILRQADRVVELKARIDPVSPDQMPEASSSRSFVP